MIISFLNRPLLQKIQNLTHGIVKCPLCSYISQDAILQTVIAAII